MRSCNSSCQNVPESLVSAAVSAGTHISDYPFPGQLTGHQVDPGTHVRSCLKNTERITSEHTSPPALLTLHDRPFEVNRKLIDLCWLSNGQLNSASPFLSPHRLGRTRAYLFSQNGMTGTDSWYVGYAANR